MKTPMAPNIALAIIAFTAVATVALRAAARRPGPQGMPGTEPAPTTLTADDCQRRLAAPAGTHDRPAWHGQAAGPPGSASQCR
jgi:hypothetical protein